MPNSAPLADMPMISTAPRLAEMNARPVTHAGSDAPGQEEVQRLRDLALGQEADAQHEREVDERIR
jgi:hypothetical protein